jgi:hypothetical protein
MNINEIIQWLVLLGIVVLMLGLYRQLAVFLTANATDFELSSGPAIQRRLPERVLTELDRLGVLKSREALLLAFISEGCGGCQRLLGSLTEDSLTKIRKSHELKPILVALSPSDRFAASLHELSVPVVEDDGTLWAMCNVQATPSLVKVNARGVVTAKAISPNIEGFAHGP